MNVIRDEAVVGLNQQNVPGARYQSAGQPRPVPVGDLTRTDVAQSEARWRWPMRNSNPLRRS